MTRSVQWTPFKEKNMLVRIWIIWLIIKNTEIPYGYPSPKRVLLLHLCTVNNRNLFTIGQISLSANNYFTKIAEETRCFLIAKCMNWLMWIMIFYTLLYICQICNTYTLMKVVIYFKNNQLIQKWNKCSHWFSFNTIFH